MLMCGLISEDCSGTNLRADKKDGRPKGSRSLWGDSGTFACACTANVPESEVSSVLVHSSKDY